MKRTSPNFCSWRSTHLAFFSSISNKKKSAYSLRLVHVHKRRISTYSSIHQYYLHSYIVTILTTINSFPLSLVILNIFLTQISRQTASHDFIRNMYKLGEKVVLMCHRRQRTVKPVTWRGLDQSSVTPMTMAFCGAAAPRRFPPFTRSLEFSKLAIAFTVPSSPILTRAT